MCKLTSMVDSGMQSRFLPPNISLSGSSLSNLLDVKPDDNIMVLVLLELCIEYPNSTVELEFVLL